MSYLLFFAVGLTAAAGDLLVFRWSKTNESWALVASLVVWCVSLVLFGLLLRDGRGLGVTFVWAVVMHTAIILGWDLLVTKAEWSRLEWAGILLAVVGIVLIEMGHVDEAGG